MANPYFDFFESCGKIIQYGPYAAFFKKALTGIPLAEASNTILAHARASEAAS